MALTPARRRRYRWLAAILVLDIVDFSFSYHAHLTYVGGPGKPTIMPVGQLLGWATSVMLLIVFLLLAWSTYRTRNLPSYRHVVPPRYE